MRGPRVLSHPPSDRNPQRDCRAPGAGSNLDLPADTVCPLLHAAETVPVVILGGIESPALVRNS